MLLLFFLSQKRKKLLKKSLNLNFSHIFEFNILYIVSPFF
ncbi:hypothetical protein PRO82_001980 [Candidatus Protochlamydia amoebophila]|nr:hypothetical protein [Candidatus Protochlamydia amoebophila]